MLQHRSHLIVQYQWAITAPALNSGYQESVLIVPLHYISYILSSTSIKPTLMYGSSLISYLNVLMPNQMPSRGSVRRVKLSGQQKPSFHWTRTWEVQHYCGNDRGCRDPAECREWHLRLFPISRYNWSVCRGGCEADNVRCVPSHREGRPVGGPTFTSSSGSTGLRWQVIGWDMKYEVQLNGHILTW